MLLRIEASWWMTRLSFAWAPMLVPIGWFAAVGAHDYGRLVLTMVSLGCAGGTVTVLNDIFDRHKDAVTAPELPLASGLVSVTQAVATGGVLTCGFLAFLALASASVGAFVSATAVGAAAGGLIGAYSATKWHPVVAPMLAATVYAGVPFISWCAAGGGDPQPLLEVLAYAVCFGLATNIYTGAQDMDKDPDVGNSSIAVRLGMRLAFLLAGGLDAAAIVCVLLAALYLKRGDVGGVVALISLGVIAGSHVAAHRRGRGVRAGKRAEWVTLTSSVTLSRLVTQVAFVAIFSIPAAFGLASLLGLMLIGLIHGYKRRVVLGGLRRDLEAFG
jgi:geranylgeranylglycerol-phosphate geranylgeranyltransferase